MSERTRARQLSRREFIKAGTVMAGAAALSPALTTPAVAATAARPKTVPRNRTLILVWFGSREGRWVDYELWNPYAIGSNHQNGPGIFYEPLAYYSAFADKQYMWLAESYKYTPDFKELTIKTRSGIRWSDGAAFSAEDVAYTLNSLRDLGPKVRWGVDVQQFMQEARATNPTTVVIKFKIPSPRFFDFMTYKYDIGVYIVPKHIFQGQDWTMFKHYDPAKDWPVTTSPWRVAFASPEQKVIDRRDEWWAAKAGLASLPKVERNIWLPSAGEQQAAQALITNQLDYGMAMQPSTFPTMIRQNPKIISHSGQKPPYGYMDWWPISLYLNNERPPFNDKDVRWAISYFVDRKQIVDVGYVGASLPSPLPLPEYPALRPYIDSVKDLLAKHNTLEFNPKKGEELLTNKGWKKDSAGFWADTQGNRLKLDIIGFGSSGPAIGPVITELLRRQGVDASFSLPPDFDDRFQKGQYSGSIYGHGGSVNDPYYTLRLYQSASEAVPGGHLVNFARWKNPVYDKIVDEVYVTDMTNKAKLTELWRKAMEIWIPDLPDIPLVHNFHRIPMNTTYWTNWPTEQNPYINGAFWHLTYAIVLWNLQPTQ
ncbi:MAG TPA: ABC transporter substrate-binding protein [Candidatus Methylomirabilis sp.]|nr:ABC transporter substrate-binding protein [Candidatus Methylomirabilis sp.]